MKLLGEGTRSSGEQMSKATLSLVKEYHNQSEGFLSGAAALLPPCIILSALKWRVGRKEERVNHMNSLVFNGRTQRKLLAKCDMFQFKKKREKSLQSVFNKYSNRRHHLAKAAVVWF